MNDSSNVISTLDRFQTHFAKLAYTETIQNNVGIKKIVCLAEQALI